MRIKKLSGGGLPSLVSFINVEQPLPSIGEIGTFGKSEETDKKSKKSDDDDGILDKEMRKMLLEKGLPSDVLAFIKNSDIFYLLNFDLSTSYGKVLHSQMYRLLLSILPEIRLNKEEYDDAIQHAREKGTLSEFAVTSQGFLYVQNEKGKLELRDPSKLLKNDRILTYGYLAQMRAYNPANAFDKGLLTETIAGSISLKLVIDVIDKVAKEVGKDTLSNEMYVRKDGQMSKVREGIAKMLEESEPGVYKLSEKSVNSDSTINLAVNYILQQLSPQQLGLLKAHANRLGLNNKTGIVEFVTKAVRSQLDTTYESHISYEKDLSEEAGLAKTKSGSSKGLDMNDVDSTPASRFFAGMGDFKPYQFRIGDTTATYIAYGNSTYVSKNGGDPMGHQLLLSELSLSDLNGGVDLTQASFGGVPISPTDANKILINGDKVVAVELPYKEVDGKIVPEISAMNTIAEILKNNKSLIEQGKFAEVNKIFVSKGLQPYFSADGTTTNFYKRFAVMQAYADEEVLDYNSSRYNIIGEYSDVDDYELGEIVAQLKEKNKKAGIKYTPSHPSIMGIGIPFTSENIVKSMIFVPINRNAVSWYQGKMKSGEAQQMETASQERLALLDSADAIQRYKPVKNIF